MFSQLNSKIYRRIYVRWKDGFHLAAVYNMLCENDFLPVKLMTHSLASERRPKKMKFKMKTNHF